MTDIEVLEKYRKDQFIMIQKVLNKSSELITFIRVYGSLYDTYYNGFILNLNNISERYLESLDSRVIDRLYDAYTTARENKTEKETFEQLRNILYELPVSTISEVSERTERRRNLDYSQNVKRY